MIPTTIDDYVSMLKKYDGPPLYQDVPFALINFGDGEWSWILNKEITNCDGMKWTSDLSRYLQKIMLYPRLFSNMFYGTNPGKRLKAEVEEWSKSNDAHESINWVDKEIISNANCQGKLQPFFEALNWKTRLIVGPAHLGQLTGFFKFTRIYNQVVIDLPLDFEGRELYLERVRTAIHQSGACVVLFSAGPLTNFLIHELWPECESKGITLIDMGACFDPYCGVMSRSGYRKASNIEKMKANKPC